MASKEPASNVREDETRADGQRASPPTNGGTQGSAATGEGGSIDAARPREPEPGRPDWRMNAGHGAVADLPSLASVLRFGRVEMSEAELQGLSDSGLRDRLVAGGISRLSAERIVAIARGKAECGRARAHGPLRR
jgi:hypothetical protein